MATAKRVGVEFVCNFPEGYDDRFTIQTQWGSNKIYAVATGLDKPAIRKQISPKVGKYWRKICPKN